MSHIYVIAAAPLVVIVAVSNAEESLKRTGRAGDRGNVGLALHAEAQWLAAAEAVLQSVHSGLRLRCLAPSVCSADDLCKDSEAQQETVGQC